MDTPLCEEIDVSPFAFRKADLLNPAVVAQLPVKNPRVIVTDCPWECDFLASNHDKDTYALAPEAKLLQLFRTIRGWFTPTEDEPNGHLIVWFTNDKLELALRCLIEAGYTYIGINSWHKATYEGVPYKMSPFRGNVEMFIIGEKLVGDAESLCKTQRGFCAPPFITMHSSKPLEFYTVFLPFFAKANMYGRPWEQVEKVDLFTRHSQHGFLSVGNEFYGRRSDSVPRTLRTKKHTANNKNAGRKRKVRDLGMRIEVRGTHKAKWGAVILGESESQYLVQWDRPVRGCPAEEWVNKDVVKSHK